MDEVDFRVLAELRKDGRASVSAVAQATHISRANAYARVKRLIESGVIIGFGARVDPVLAGQHSSAYVTLTVEQASWQEIRARLSQIPEVVHVALVGGDYDVMILVRARDNGDLRRVVLEELQAIPAVRATKTALIFEDFETTHA
ncbi:MAG: Lrp/AsnC family transcriptional regulator [Rhodoglobus sp.]|uniref:Lrp/AsnC family transcriptional regulator n=1 Tax=Salinibacterium sp. G-O1 TaxID=3046208 RepID=UPI0024B92757|nr:Lrp/AsnC family transcriptional regulator [Salinibacterium sp. G-O1]MDJ0336320.1 Lrp/AsnC family transcriptional regulator [Salinibacterium sp. G-O1]